MKSLLSAALGILTAVGGFVDIGDLVTSALVGSRFGLSLAWATLLGAAGICLFADMSGRIAAISGRGTFDLVRERLGARAGLANLVTAGPRCVGFDLVTEIASDVRVARIREELDVDPFGQWVDRYVIARIPGSRHAGE